MRARPVLAAATSLALLGGAAGAAAEGAEEAQAVGSATSTLTLLDVTLGGQALSVLELALRSEAGEAGPGTSFVVTPMTMDGTAYGRQSVRSRTGALPAVDSRAVAPDAVTQVAAVRTPAVDVTTEGGSSEATTSSLGAVSVLGVPLRVAGELSISSSVDAAAASGGKTVRLEGLALPSLAELLGALGLDLRALPAASLTELLDRLDLGSTSTDAAVAALEQALADVQAEVDALDVALADADAAAAAAQAQLESAQAAVAPATRVLNDATRALTGTTAGLRAPRASLLGDVLTPLNPVLEPALPPVPAPVLDLVDEVEDVVEDVDPVLDPVLDTVTDPLAPVVDPVIDPVVEVLEPLPTLPVDVPDALRAAYDTARAAYDTALVDVTDARRVLDTATQLLADAAAALDALLAPHRARLDAVVDAVVDVLAQTPLISLDRLEVTTRSTVTSAGDGGQVAEIVAGQVEGLRVLGADVLDEVVGSSEVDVLDVTGPLQARIDGAVDGLTATVGDVLSEVPGLPGLHIPAPRIELLRSAAVTEVAGGFGVAGSALRALSVSWPGLRVPAAVAVPGAATLPGVGGLPSLGGSLRTAAVGDVLSQPLTLAVATLEDRARFRPAPASLPAPDSPDDGGVPDDGLPGDGTPGGGTPETDGPRTGTPGTPVDGGAPPSTTSNPRGTPVGLTQLPRTGASGAASALALLLIATSIALHRRYRSA